MSGIEQCPEYEALRMCNKYDKKSGADPENLHGRWLTGWLPIVNHTGVKGGGWLIMVDISYTTLHKLKNW